MISYRGREIRGETIALDQKDVYFLGPDLTLRDCTLTIAVPDRDLILATCRFEGCRIVTKKRLANTRWENVTFADCRFGGSYAGNVFAHGEGRCDFSEAILETCELHDFDVAQVTFPRWPCFTIVNPREHVEAILASPWPGKSRVVAEVLAECEAEVRAVTYVATAIAKRYKVAEAELRAAIATIPDVRA